MVRCHGLSGFRFCGVGKVLLSWFLPILLFIEYAMVRCHGLGRVGQENSSEANTAHTYYRGASVLLLDGGDANMLF